MVCWRCEFSSVSILFMSVQRESLVDSNKTVQGRTSTWSLLQPRQIRKQTDVQHFILCEACNGC